VRGRAYDYQWCPASAELRRIAFSQLWLVKGRASDLRRVLSAAPRIEFSLEHRRNMSERIAKLGHIAASLVGGNGSGEEPGG
jgi:hypothetical protein